MTKATCRGIGPCRNAPISSSLTRWTPHSAGGEDSNHLRRRVRWAEDMSTLLVREETWTSGEWEPWCNKCHGLACHALLRQLSAPPAACQLSEKRETIGPPRVRNSAAKPLHTRARLSSNSLCCFRIRQLFHLASTTRSVTRSSHIVSSWRPSPKSSCRACWTASTPCDWSISVSTRDVLFSRLSWLQPNHRLVHPTLCSHTTPLLLCDEQPLALDLQLFAALTDNTP